MIEGAIKKQQQWQINLTIAKLSNTHDICTSFYIYLQGQKGDKGSPGVKGDMGAKGEKGDQGSAAPSCKCNLQVSQYNLLKLWFMDDASICYCARVLFFRARIREMRDS